MSEFVFILILNALEILFFFEASGPGMIFGFLYDLDEAVARGTDSEGRKVYDFLTKPLWGCRVCMASVHGSLFWLLTWAGDLHRGGGITEFVVHCVCLSGLMALYNEVTNKN